MTLLALLEKDKERLIAGLQLSRTPDRADQVIAEEIDRLLLMYNEDCDMAEKREAAAHMLQTARIAASLTDTVGESRVWDELPQKEASRGSLSGIAKLALLLGLVTMVVSLVLGILSNPAELHASDVLMTVLFAAGSGAAFCFAGRKMAPARIVKSGAAQKIEHYIDPQKVYVTLHNMMIGMDQCLDQILPPAQQTSEEGLVAGMDRTELELFAGLLEAAASRDGQYALDRMSEVRYYLHKRGIEMADYNGSNADMFDFLPSKNRRTIRPAMLVDGKVIKRGVAAGEK